MADSSFEVLLKNAFQDEAFRRMARRAGVHATSQKQTDSVNWALRKIGEQILETMIEKMVIYSEHRMSKTITDADFKSACDFLKIKTGSLYAIPDRDDGKFPKCKSYSAGQRREKRDRGARAKLETRHENKDLSCVYNETAPFARLVHEIVARCHGDWCFCPQALSRT